ncbi:MAG: AAA family ATPase [Candidatus Nanopelagicales bacterium]
MLPIAEIVSNLSRGKAKLGETTLIAIDGPSGAGKTTLSKQLEYELNDVETIHMDDLYAGWKDALSQELYERISTQILTPLSLESVACYQKYNWYTNKFEDWVELDCPRYLLLEGVGAAAIPNRQWISFSVYMDVSDSLGLERVRRRDGDAIVAFIPEWQEMQRQHFEEHQTKASADLLLEV